MSIFMDCNKNTQYTSMFVLGLTVLKLFRLSNIKKLNVMVLFFELRLVLENALVTDVMSFIVICDGPVE